MKLKTASKTPVAGISDSSPEAIEFVDAAKAIDWQAGRAEEICRLQACPHCTKPLSRFEILSLAHGSGTIGTFLGVVRDGRLARIEDRYFNPRSMLMLPSEVPK
jgi:hypothetical protein